VEHIFLPSGPAFLSSIFTLVPQLSAPPLILFFLFKSLYICNGEVSSMHITLPSSSTVLFNFIYFFEAYPVKSLYFIWYQSLPGFSFNISTVSLQVIPLPIKSLLVLGPFLMLTGSSSSGQ